MKVNKRFADYVEGLNFWKRFAKKPLLVFPLTQADVDEIARRLDNDMEPENISCDGELSRAQVQAKYNKLSGVKKDLAAYCAKNGLLAPVVWHNY